MAESIYRGLQFGVESTYGTAVPATFIIPVDEGSGEFQLQRGTRFPEEDFGTQVSFMSTRGSHGVRLGSGSIASDARFEDLGRYLDMMIGAGVGGVHTAGTTTDTTVSYTVETTNDVQAFIATGVKATSLTLEYDAIAAGENSPWRVSADLVANNVVAGTATAALTIPASLETMEGHLTQLYQGPIATGFALLPELAAHLIQYSLTIEQDKPLRPYGGTTEIATTVGLRKRQSTFSAMLKLSATSITDVYNIFGAAGGALGERRWRLKVTGSGTKSMLIDHRVAFMNVERDPDGRDGEYTLSIEGNCTYDATLASDLVITLVTA